MDRPAATPPLAITAPTRLDAATMAARNRSWVTNPRRPAASPTHELGRSQSDDAYPGPDRHGQVVDEGVPQIVVQEGPAKRGEDAAPHYRRELGKGRIGRRPRLKGALRRRTRRRLDHPHGAAVPSPLLGGLATVLEVGPRSPPPQTFRLGRHGPSVPLDPGPPEAVVLGHRTCARRGISRQAIGALPEPAARFWWFAGRTHVRPSADRWTRPRPSPGGQASSASRTSRTRMPRPLMCLRKLA